MGDGLVSPAATVRPMVAAIDAGDTSEP